MERRAMWSPCLHLSVPYLGRDPYVEPIRIRIFPNNWQDYFVVVVVVEEYYCDSIETISC